jgi:hypothetical protein
VVAVPPLQPLTGTSVVLDVTIDDLRLNDIAHDSNTLRVIANANGAVNVAISSLAMR